MGMRMIVAGWRLSPESGHRGFIFEAFGEKSGLRTEPGEDLQRTIHPSPSQERREGTRAC